jgi:hypothetical protein
MAQDDARRLLGALAGDGPTDDGTDTPGEADEYARTIDRATSALEDVEAAATFVAEGGLEGLEAAIERAERDLSEAATRGRSTLEAYREYRAVARGREESREDT